MDGACGGRRHGQTPHSQPPWKGQYQQLFDFVTLYTRLTQGSCMAQGRKTALVIRLTPAEHLTLLTWQRGTTVSAGLARRARIILLRAEGVPVTAIAATVGMGRRHVYKWLHRFQQEKLAGLEGQSLRRRFEAVRAQDDMDVG